MQVLDSTDGIFNFPAPFGDRKCMAQLHVYACKICVKVELYSAHGRQRRQARCIIGHDIRSSRVDQMIIVDPIYYIMAHERNEQKLMNGSRSRGMHRGKKSVESFINHLGVIEQRITLKSIKHVIFV